jgi:acetylornithine deacetylase/succinyl-diaminopimelate desuccinylase-like protein
MTRALLFLALSISVSAQTATQVREYRQQHAPEIIRSFAELLTMRNVARDTPEGHADIQRNIDYIAELFEKRGLKTQQLNVEGGFPALYAELLTPGATKTVVFYAHYDGQPVDPTKWNTPPFEPVLRDGEKKLDIAQLQSLPADSDEWRIYARSASDDKAPVIGFLTALDAMKANGITPSVNLKFFLEGEEEAGSEHLGAILDKYADLLKADLWLICDGPAHQSGRMQLVFGARGVMGLEMTVYGPNRGLHSGHYGNWAPNPAAEIANVIASMRDAEGRIKIADFYAPVTPPSPAESKALAAIPPMDDQLAKTFGLGRTEGNGAKLNRLIMQPALNVRGIRAGAVGYEAANAISTEATASIDFRLVPKQTPELVRRQVEAHLKALGYFVVYDAPDEATRRAHRRVVRLQWEGGYPAARTRLDSPVGVAVGKTMESAVDGPIINMPTLGGSVPMYLFEQKLRVPVLLLPIANYDNNQHSHNENIRLKNLWDGIEIYATMFSDLGKNWK